MASSFFRVPETLELEGNADALDLLNEWITERGNNVGLQADDVQSLVQLAEENRCECKHTVDTLAQVAASSCESLQEDNAEDMKICVYLSTLLVVKATEVALKDQMSKKSAKQKGRAAAPVASWHMDSIWKQMELLKNVTSLPKGAVNETMHGKSLMQFCQHMALRVAGSCTKASQHTGSLSCILASADTFDTVSDVAADVKVFLEEHPDGPAVVSAISEHSAPLGREVLALVLEDIGGLDSKDTRVKNLKEYLACMAKSCMELLGPNLVFLQRVLVTSQDTFAATILHCFLQYALQRCAEPLAPGSEAAGPSAGASIASIVQVFETRSLDKTAAVRITALQCITELAENGVLTEEMFPSVTTCARARLTDRLVSVRKHALKTVEALVSRNPFGHKLAHEAAFSGIEQEVQRLASRKSVRRASMAAAKAAQVEDGADDGGCADDEENSDPNAAVAEVEAQFGEFQQILEKHKPRLAFLNAVADTIPALEILLSSDQEGDVSGAVDLLKYLRAFDVPGASSALTKALRLVNSSLPSARVVLVDMFSEVYLSDKSPAEVLAGLLQLLESDPSLALEKALRTCLELALEAGTEIPQHRLPPLCITAALRHMNQRDPQAADVHRAELFMRLLTIFAAMKPAACCGHLESLLKIRTRVLRVNQMGGMKGALLHIAVVKVILLMAGDPACRNEVLHPEALQRIVAGLLHVKGPHSLALADTAVKGLFAACRNGKGAVNSLLRVLQRLARASMQQISAHCQRTIAGAPLEPQHADAEATHNVGSGSAPRSSSTCSQAPSPAAACVTTQLHDSTNASPQPEGVDASSPRGATQPEGATESSPQPEGVDATSPHGATPPEDATESSPQHAARAACTTPAAGAEASPAQPCAQQQLHNACGSLAHHFAFLGSLTLCQAAFIEHRMEVAQRLSDNLPSKKNQKPSDAAMAGVFHCADIADDQELLQKELLGTLRTASDVVVLFCGSKLLLRANTSLRMHACICIMRLANVDSEVAERALPIVFFLLHHSNRGKVEEEVCKQIVNGLADMMYYKPSLMMAYSKNIFELLVQEHHQHMRLHVTQLVVKLVLSSVLRFKEGVGKLVFLLVDTDPQVQRQVEYLFKKLHEQDKHSILSCFPEVLQSLCNSSLQSEQRDSIITALAPFITADKQNRGLVDCMIGRLMVELPDVENAKYCLRGVWLLKSGGETCSAIIKAIHKVAVAVPALGEKLEDEEFAKLLLDTSKKALNKLLKQSRKAEDGRVIEMQAAVSQIEELVTSCLHEPQPEETQGRGEGGSADAGGGADVDVEMQDSEMQDSEQ